MKSFLYNRYWIFLLRLALGLIFIYASLDKILNPVDFAKAIANYRLLPPILVNVSAVIIPWLEALIGVALILGLFADGALFIIAVLLLVFIGGMAQAILRGIDIACGCFGVSSETSRVSWVRVGEDLLMLIAAVNIMGFRWSRFRQKKSSS